MILKRSNKYFPIIEKYLKKYNIPDDFKCSYCRKCFENVTSQQAQRVLWFMKKTGLAYGLEINDLVDEGTMKNPQNLLNI